VKLDLAPLLLDARRVLPTDLDHAAARRLGREAGTPEVRAEVVCERRITESNEQSRRSFIYAVGNATKRLDPRKS